MDELETVLAEIGQIVKASTEPENSYKMSSYEEHGYLDRSDYLTCLASDYAIDLETLVCLADILGESEDFDGLIASLEDYYE